MLALDALLQLGVDVERHLRIGVADLAHDPEDVEAIGEQRDRDVGAAQGVRRGAGQRRQAALADSLGGARGGLADDPPDALTGDPPSARVGKGVGVGVGAPPGAAQAIEVRDELLDELRAHLHLTHARLGLGVGDPEARAVGIVQAHLADAQIAQLAGADAAARQRSADRATTLIAARRLDAEADQVVADRGLGEPQRRGDVLGPHALGNGSGDRGAGAVQPLAGYIECWHQGTVLLAGGVDQRNELVHLEERSRRLGRLDAHPAPARRVALDVLILDGLVENAAQRLDELLDRRQPEGSDPPSAPVAQLGARGDGTPQLLRFAQLGLLEAQAHTAVDLVQAVLAEEGQQVHGQAPAVVSLRVGVYRLVADDALGLRR